MRRWRTPGLGVLGLLVLSTTAVAQLGGVDTQAAPSAITAFEPEVLERWSNARVWLRTGPLPDPGVADASVQARVARERDALAALSAGYKFEVLARVRWSVASWSSGVRPGGGRRVPLDLQEAYQRAKGYAIHYGQHVGGFEFENEPDIGFVEENPETYMAFLKACYLGVKAGMSEVEAARGTSKRQAWRRFLARVGDRVGWARRARQPWVVMAPLALPPGPYFEQMVNNGLFGYTDVFNYHYYGYAEDFSDVYRQFRDAFAPTAPRNAETLTTEMLKKGSAFGERQEGGAAPKAPRNSETLTQRNSAKMVAPQVRPEAKQTATEAGALGAAEGANSEMLKEAPADGERQLGAGEIASDFSFQDVSVSAFPAAPRLMRRVPVMLSEFGYGRLGESARETVEGRVRQWAWFREVAQQIRRERIAGPIAFRFRSTLERGIYDFGLTMPEAAGDDQTTERERDAAQMPAGSVAFRAADFGAAEIEPWMSAIGQRFGGAEASPALAWLTGYGEDHRYRARDWKIRAPVASPVVIDFVADETVSQRKRYRGYLVMGGGDAARVSGTGTVVVYNFSNETMRGRLLAARAGNGGPLTVDGGQRTVLAKRPGEAEKLKNRDADIESWELELAPMARVTIPVQVGLEAKRFVGTRWDLRFEPEGRAGAVAEFSTVLYPNPVGMRETTLRTFDAGAAESMATRERLLTRPLASEEPRLAEAGRWLVTPGVTVADDGDGRWRFTVAPTDDPARQRVMAELPLADDFVFPDDAVMRLRYRLAEPAGGTAQMGRYLQIYFRTANGNLYVVWPWAWTTGVWAEYFEAKANYTMMFHGRAALPWRFGENRPVALVFAFVPEERPLVFEVRDARIGRIGRAAL